MSIEQCPAGHPTPLSKDRTVSGACRECHKESNRLLRLKKKAALDVVRVFEAAGVRFVNGTEPVDADEVAKQLVEKYGHILD
jgi:hypothetical protein